MTTFFPSQITDLTVLISWTYLCFLYFKAFNCLENIPFFHPTEDKGEAIDASLELSVVEEMSNDTNKLSFKVL